MAWIAKALGFGAAEPVLPTTAAPRKNAQPANSGRNAGNVVLNVAADNGSGAVTVGGLKAAQLQATARPSTATTTQGGGRRSTKGKGKGKGKAKKRSTRK